MTDETYTRALEKMLYLCIRELYVQGEEQHTAMARHLIKLGMAMLEVDDLSAEALQP